MTACRWPPADSSRLWINAQSPARNTPFLAGWEVRPPGRWIASIYCSFGQRLSTKSTPPASLVPRAPHSRHRFPDSLHRTLWALVVRRVPSRRAGWLHTQAAARSPSSSVPALSTAARMTRAPNRTTPPSSGRILWRQEGYVFVNCRPRLDTRRGHSVQSGKGRDRTDSIAPDLSIPGSSSDSGHPPILDHRRAATALVSFNQAAKPHLQRR